MVKQASALNDQKKYDLAIQYCTQAIGYDARNAWAYMMRGRAYLLKKSYEQAIQDYNKAIEINPAYDSAYNGRGNAYGNKGDNDKALQDYQKAISLNSRYAGAYNNVGLIYVNKRDFEQAFKYYNKALEIDPTRGSFYRTRGRAYETTDNHELAIKDYNKAIEIDPKDAWAYFYRGFSYLYEDNYDQAIRDFDKTLVLDSTIKNVYNERGRAYYGKGDYEQAIGNFNKLLERDSLHKYALLNILPCLIRLNRFAEAATLYERYKINKVNGYLEHESWKYYKSYLNAATLYVRKGDYINALAEVKAAEAGYTSYNTSKKADSVSSSDPVKRYVDILALKSYVLDKLNRKEEARDVCSQALVINANQPDVAARLSILRNGQAQAAITDRTAPVIELYTPASSGIVTQSSDNNTVQVVGRAKDVSGIGSLSINGKAVRNIEEDGVFVSATELKQGVNKITIAATDRAGNRATRDFMVTFQRTTNTALADLPLLSTLGAPRYYAVLIAEKDYGDKKSFPSLNNPLRDALKLKQVLETRYGFSASDIDTLFNSSREDILGTLTQRCGMLKDNDNLLIFYAGHGTAEKDRYGNIDGYLVPCSARKGNYGSYISSNDIATALKRSTARHILFIADACFSGSLGRSIDELDDMPRGVKTSYEKKSRKMMTSGNLDPVPDNSVFMYHMLDRLEKNKEKYLIGYQLFDGFKEAVVNNSGTKPQHVAILNTGDEGGDFVFIRK